MSPQEIKEKINAIGCVDLVLIDYLQLIAHRKNAQEIIRNLKLMAVELDTTVLILSQLSRTVEQRQDHRPQLVDLQSYNSFETDVDIVLFLYIDAYYKGHLSTENKFAAECIIAKNSHGDIGITPLRWNGEYIKFVSCDSIKSK